MIVFLSRALPGAVDVRSCTLDLALDPDEIGRAGRRPYKLRLRGEAAPAAPREHVMTYLYLDEAAEGFYAQEELYALRPPPVVELLLAEGRRHPGLFRSYHTDLLVHDRRILAAGSAGDEFLWVLRECGTQMLPLYLGMEPQIATYWLRGADSLPESERPRTYHIVLRGPGEGSLREVSHAEAHQLAEAPRRLLAAA